MNRSRTLAFSAVVAAVLAAPTASFAASSPVTLKGIVVAHDAARGTLAVASSTGAVSTLRTASARRIGSRVSVRGLRLADGTVRATRIVSGTRVRTARVHGVVVRLFGSRLLLSAGGSIFSLHLGRRLASARSQSLDPGSIVNATVSINGTSGDLEEQGVQDVGQADLVSLEGTISSIASGSLVLSVEEGAQTTVTVPSSITLPTTILAGDRVEVLAQVAAGAFTLVTIQDDHATAHGDHGANMTTGTGEAAQVEAEGAVTGLNSGSLVVQSSEHASSITFAVPADFALPAIQLGDPVEARGSVASDGTVTLTRIEVKHEDDSQQHNIEVEAEGTVTAVSSTSLTIQPNESSNPVTFQVPSGVDTSAVQVGATASAKGTRAADGTLTLTRIEADGSQSSSDGGDSGSTSGGTSGNSGGDG